ncbi:hypothetical protein [Streptomyces goshikiensis]|uniref:hypothetical protein n=1 Tax=Streptomyces goshikiensis TaxID=1942 RepID=UPI0036843980
MSQAPESITAGGGWANVSVHVDNAGKNAGKQFDLGMILSRLDPARMDGDQIQVEVYSRDERGVLGWHPTYDRLGEEDRFAYEIASGPVGSGAAEANSGTDAR